MNKYLRKIAAVLSLTLVLTSFDCTALRAVNTAEINAVSSDYNKLTKQGDANKAEQAKPAESNEAKSDGAAKKQAATKQDEGKAEATKATKIAKEPSISGSAEAQPKYIIAEPVNKTGARSKRSIRESGSVPESQQGLLAAPDAYRKSVISVPLGLEQAGNGMDRSAPTAENVTGATPKSGEVKANGEDDLKSYGDVPTDGLGFENGEKADPKVKEPDGAYLNRHLPLKARYLGDTKDKKVAQSQLENTTPPATYSYKLHFVLLRYITTEDGKSYFAKSKEFHKPYQITVGEDDLTPSVDGTKFDVPHKEGYENPIVVDGLLPESQDKNTIDALKASGEKVDYKEITFKHHKGTSNTADKSTYYIQDLAKQTGKKGYHLDKVINQNVFEQTFVYMPKKANITFKYLYQDQSVPTQFNENEAGLGRCVESSIGAQFSPTSEDYYPDTSSDPALEKEIRDGFMPANEKINVLVPETDQCGDFTISLHLLRKNYQAIFDVVEEAADKVPTRQFAYGQTITFPQNEPKYEGYEFLGWLPANGKNVYQYDATGKHEKTIFDSEKMKKEREEVIKELEALLTSDEKKMGGKELEGDALVNRALMKAKIDKPQLLERYKNTFLPNQAIKYAMPPENITFKAQWMMKPTGKYTYSYWLEKPEDPEKIEAWQSEFSAQYDYLYSEDGEHAEATFTPFTSDTWIEKLQKKTKDITDGANAGNYHTKFFEWDNLNREFYNRARFDDFFEFDAPATKAANAGQFVTGNGKADCKIIFRRRRYTVVFTWMGDVDENNRDRQYSITFRSKAKDKEGNPILLPKYSTEGEKYSFQTPADSRAVAPQPDLTLTEAERKNAPYQFTARFGQKLDKVWPNPFANCSIKDTENRSYDFRFWGWQPWGSPVTKFFFDSPPIILSPDFLYVQREKSKNVPTGVFYYKCDRRGYINETLMGNGSQLPSVISVHPLLLFYEMSAADLRGWESPYVSLFKTQTVDGEMTYLKNASVPHWLARVDVAYNQLRYKDETGKWVDTQFPKPQLKGFTAVAEEADAGKSAYDGFKPNAEQIGPEVWKFGKEILNMIPQLEPNSDPAQPPKLGKLEKNEFDLDLNDLSEICRHILNYGWNTEVSKEEEDRAVIAKAGGILQAIRSENKDMRLDHQKFAPLCVLKYTYARNRYPITIENAKNVKPRMAFYDESLTRALHTKDEPMTAANRPDNIPQGWVFDGYTFDKENKYPVDGYTLPDNPITVFAKWIDPKIHDLTIDLAGGHLEKLPEQSELTKYEFNNSFYKAADNPIRVKTKDGEQAVPVDKLKDCNPYSVDTITYRIKSGKNVLPFSEVPTKADNLFLGWEAVRYKLNDKKEIQRDKDGKPIEDKSYWDNYKAHEFFSFNNPMAEPMGIRAIWGKLEYKPVYIEHHFFDKQSHEIGKELDLSKLLPGIDTSEFLNPLKGVLKVKRNAVPGSNLAAMADYENDKWVLVSNDKNGAVGDTDLEKIYQKNYPEKTLPSDFKNKFIQNKLVEKEGTNIIRFFYQPFRHRFYYISYTCVDDDEATANPSSPKPIYNITRDLDKVHNDNFDYDVINYKPLHGYKLYVPDAATTSDKKWLQQVAKFTEDSDGNLKINGEEGTEFAFKYKDYRVLVRNSMSAATPDHYHRVIFELDKNMEFATNYQGAFNGATESSSLKEFIKNKKDAQISDLLGVGDKFDDAIRKPENKPKDPEVCTRRYIVDVADGVDDANIPLPPIRPMRFLPVSLLWIDQKGLNFYSKKLYESTPGEIEEEDLEKTLDEAVPSQPELERNLSLKDGDKVNVELTPKNGGTEENKLTLELSTKDLKDKGDYKDQPRWVNIEKIQASQNLVCQRVSGSPRKDANDALTEPKALTDGTLARNENADNAKLAADANACSADNECKKLESNAKGHEGEGKWDVKEPDMNKLELTDFADLTFDKNDPEKFVAADEKQEGVPAWQKKPYQKKTINVFAKGSDKQGTDSDCCNIKIDENKLPPRIWTKAFLDKLKEIDGQPHDIFEWSASEEGAQEQTDGVEKGIFVEHKVLVNNKESTRLFEVELFGSTETELFVVNSEVPTIDVEVQKYWYGKYGQPLDFNTLSVGSAANPKPLTMEMRFMDPRILLKPQTVDLTAANKWHDWIRNVRLKFRRTSPRTYDYELHEVGDSGGTLSYGGKKFDAIYIGRCLDGFKVINREQTYGFPPVVAICDCARMGMNKAYSAVDRAYTAVSEAASKAGSYIKRQVGKLFGGNGRQTETNGQGGCSSCHLD